MKWSMIMATVSVCGMFGLMMANLSLEEETKIDAEEFLGPESMMVVRNYTEAA